MQPGIVITVDTSELRNSASPERLSPHVKQLQQRLAGWTPKSPTQVSFADKLNGASRRRHSLVEERTSKLQESNTRASVVAEQQRAKYAEEISGKAAHVAAKGASAEQKRKAFVSAKEEAAATHYEHAKSIAMQQKELKMQKVEKAITDTAAKSNEAGARRAKLLAEAQLKNSALVAKAKLLADQKRAEMIALRIGHEDRLAAAECRRMEIQDDMMAKLAESEQKARQVRRNKGSTPSRTAANAEKKVIAEPVAFDIEFDRQPPSPNKTPVQLRLEAAREINFNDVVDEKLEQATRRRQSLAESKAESLQKTNANKKNVAAKHSEAEKAKLEGAKQAAATKITAAEDRRKALIDSTARKAGGHVKAALENASNQKTGQQEQLVEKKRWLSQELLEHDTRREAALKVKATPLSPKRTPTKQRSLATAEC